MSNHITQSYRKGGFDEVEEIVADWFTFDAARRWMDGTLAAPDPKERRDQG